MTDPNAKPNAPLTMSAEQMANDRVNREVFGHYARAERAWHEIDALRARVAQLERERDEAIGIGPGSNDGPFKHCECGRRMVWQYPVNVTVGEPGAPAWTCPDCTSRARRVAEAALAATRAALREAATALKRARALNTMHGPCSRSKPCEDCRAALNGIRTVLRSPLVVAALAEKEVGT